MTFETFKKSLSAENPPQVESALRALWYDGRGDWMRAHEIAQDVDGEHGSWVHAYLHRKEGDRSNARYWYRQAKKPESIGSLDAEWDQIVSALLGAV